MKQNCHLNIHERNEQMFKVILCRGLPASGKSTWAKEQLAKFPGKYKRISTDDLRSMLDNGRWSKENEKFMLKTRDELILLVLASGRNVIVDATHLSPVHERHIRELVKDKAEVETKFFFIDLEEAFLRDAKRVAKVGKSVILRMYNQFLKPKIEKIVHDPNLPDAIICDLDGTLALIGNRNPYDASRCEDDKLNEPIALIVHKFFYSKDKFEVIFVSGREDKYKRETERWLLKNGFDDNRFLKLYMRAEGDFRKDSIIKREIYENYIKGKFNVEFVLDDRDSVVRAWRELGLTCLQVAEGNF